MSKPKKAIIECRNYNLPAYFPVLLLSGDIWRISDQRSNHLHFHNCVEIGVCETDSGTMEFGDDIRQFKAGDVTIVGTDIVHTTYSDKGTASKWSYIFIDIEELLAPYFPLSLIVDTIAFTAITHNYYAIFDANTYPEISILTTAIIEELKGKKENFQFSVRGLVLSWFVHLVNAYKADCSRIREVRPTVIDDNGLVIAPALDYIRNNYSHEFPIENLAEMCGMSPTHFRRVFQSIMNTSPLEYLNNLRIDKASILLRSTELPVLTISEEVGFRSVSSFNRHFQENTGTSPLKWRKQMSYIDNKSLLKYTGWLVPDK